MAQFYSQSYDNRSNFPTVMNAGVQMQHRASYKFPVATALAVNDWIVFGRLSEGYIPTAVRADSDGVANLTVDILLVDDLDSPKTTLTIATGVSLVSAGVVQGTLPMNAWRYKGLNVPMYLVAKVNVAASAAKNVEVGVILDYRYRQNTI